MCQILSRSDAAHVAPYVSFFIRRRRGGYSSICVNFAGQSPRVYRRICVKFYTTIVAPRSDKKIDHMCQILLRSVGDAYASNFFIVKSFYLTNEKILSKFKTNIE
ncbi:MAG TPA: hypothetical protein PLI57_05145 [Spirochaetota bacterium]|nr:hypothetical protein [Spirochaetota bacterium]